MLSCSTCWNSDRHTDGQAMLQEILDLGFENIELGHGIRLSLMDGVMKFVEKRAVNFTSLHNFCPLPIEVTRSSPDCYQFSSHREAERERALKLTFQTIDFASRLGAKVVVLHLGRVPMTGITDELVELAEKGEHLSRKYVRKKIAAVEEREENAPIYFQRAMDAVTKILEYAETKNIRLGIEGRHGYEEIPNENEFPELLNHFRSPFIGYWHDFGHIQIKENLGFLDHAEWLGYISPRLFGCHLHDVEWPGTDHRAPFTGSIDYDKLVPLLPKNCLFVWEMSPRRTAEEIVVSRDKWKAKFGE